MKLSRIICSITLALMILTPKGLKAEDDNKKIRDYIASNLYFFYVQNPNKPRRMFFLNSYKIVNGGTLTDKSDFWTNSKMKQGRTLVTKLLKSSKEGGDENLQRATRDILRLRNGNVKVFLYNDYAKIGKFAREAFDPCTDDKGYVWPCASSYGGEVTNDNQFVGDMHLGAKNMNAYGKEWTAATFIHELMHTQDRSDIRAHVFYSSLTGKWYDYGKDGTHYFKEAVPSMNSAYKEAIANTVSLRFEPGEEMRAFKWFQNNGDLWVETTRDRKAKDIPASAWLYNRIKKVAGPGKPIKNRKNYRAYKIRDLPARYIIHNEMIIALIFSKYGLHVNDVKFLKAIKKSNKEYKGKANSLAVLFKNMCEAGLPKGETITSVLETDAPMTYLLPFAYADYFTGYNAKTIKEFNAVFDYRINWAWLKAYWDNAREIVRNRIPIDDPTYYPIPEDLTNIAMELGIISNEAEDLN